MFYVFGISIAFFLAIVLVTKKNRTSADTVLGVWLVLMGVHLSLYYTIWVANPIFSAHLLGLEIPLPILQNVMLYLYVGVLTQRIALRNLRWLFHLLPLGLIYTWLIQFFCLPASEKLYVYAHQGAGYEFFSVFVHVLYSVSGAYYIARAAWFWRGYQRAKSVGAGNAQPTLNPNWVRGLLIGMTLIWLAVQVQQDDRYVYATAVLFVLWLGYVGIRQGDIFARTPGLMPARLNTARFLSDDLMLTEATMETGPDLTDCPKYASSGLTDETATLLYDQLSDLMQRDALYRESNLTLSGLAGRLGVHANYLSQVINEREGKRFPDYIGSLRIDAFKKVAADPRNSHLTLLALAYECGFNSKSTFNRQFKKQTGQLPSDYWQQVGHVA